MFTEISALIVNTFSQVFGFLLVLRVMLRIAGVGFGNQISTSIAAVTNPLVRPLSLVIPSWGRIDNAALVLAILTFAFTPFALNFIAGAQNDLRAIIGIGIYGALHEILFIYKWSMIIWIVASFIAPGSYHPILITISQLIQPVIRPIQRIMPSAGGLDFSPIVVFLAIQILDGTVLPTLISSVFL